MTTKDPQPFLELRIGGLHVSVQRAPVRLLTIAVTALASSVTAWLTAR